MRHLRAEPMPFYCRGCDRAVAMVWHAWRLEEPRCPDCDTRLEPRFAFPPELAEGLAHV